MYTSYNKTEKSSCVITPHEKQHNALHKAAYIQIVVIIYNKASWYSVCIYHILDVSLYITLNII